MMEAVQSLFDSLKRKPAEPAIAGEDWTAYRDLLVRLANNESLDSDQASVVSRIGKNRADVEQDASTMRKRLDAHNRLELAGDAAKELIAVDARIEKAQTTLDRARAKYDATVGPLREQRFQLQSRIDATESALRILRRTILDPRLKNEIASVEATKRQLQTRINDLAEELRLSNVGSTGNRLMADRDTLNKIENRKHGSIARGSSDHRKLAASVEQLGRQAAALEKQRAAMLAEQDRLTAKLESLRDRGLQP